MNKSIESHGLFKHGLTEHSLYSVWASMKSRCRPTVEEWGDRGIRVCQEWQEFLPFYKWAIENGYKSGLILDRENNDGNYEPSNCRWATYSVSNKNKRKPRRMSR